MSSMNRREFMKTASAAATAASVGSFSINAVGANEKVVLGVMGIHGRGMALAEGFGARKDVELKYLCDVDSNLFKSRVPQVAKVTGKEPQTLMDFRKMCDDPDIDGIVMATPNHWHALGTVLACQAGKDVYVEKPVAHNIWEGRRMVEAARKYNRIVQVGTQNRSAEYCYAAADYVKSGKLGDIHFVRIMNSKGRSVVRDLPDEDTPEGVDYDMWLGPAPLRKFNRNHFHYAWNWFWNYGAGDISNDGIHQIDLARWVIGNPTYPKSVYSTGGIHFFKDAQETPDTQVVNWDFDGMTIVFEQSLWSPYLQKTPIDKRNFDDLPVWPHSGTRVEIYGTKEFMYLGRHGDGWQTFSGDWKPVDMLPGRFTNDEHFANFVDCIRTRNKPNADIEQVHISTNWGHYGNVSYRLGRKLFIDPKTEGFINDDEANNDLTYKRKYREPWVVPEVV
ncbi:MAG TPA: Gfo/Idh/MocA family oxidoreductase [Candidatus Bathyarchaeia archaeon]|nr:Gfo/Idh/MocA family oxidoreductase [Candidatus Bathyarchaeia archaeon]